MALFGKKKEEKKAEFLSRSKAVDGISSIKVLGSGCKACHQLYDNTVKAVEGIGIKVEYVTDLQKIMEYGAMSMPALVVNKKLVSSGKVLKPADILKLINGASEM
ncbi:MAG: thioredoxin family protein [Oscillospiraceae bacterium]|nr:thioredoxin family protein [Oscillospiraceae bacterium]